jgi:hypothetical protein
MEDLLARAGEDRFAKQRAPIPPKDWRDALGPRIADRARPLSLERGVLVVKVATSVWANELQMLAPELLLRLKQRGYAVESLRFRVGPLDVIPKPPERRSFRKVPPPLPLAPELRAAMETIADDDLRAIMEKAASANLAWQSFVSPSEAPQAARAPRDAERGTAPRGRNAEGSDAASPRSSGDGGYRRK